MGSAPMTGLIIQPIIGYFSDRTWTKWDEENLFSRRYFASAALFIMPNSPLWFAAGMLWIMDASINVSMEPFRAFVGDNLPEKTYHGICHAKFYRDWRLPRIKTTVNFFTVQKKYGSLGVIPDSVKYSFTWVELFIVTVLWTVITSKEYSPEELEAFEKTQNHFHKRVSADWYITNGHS
jgi:maltose/moltooligosaccharide transporter